jgi:C4-dicarboxylate transporter DctM subunit
MEMVVQVVLLIVLMAANVPIAFALAAASLITLVLFHGLPSLTNVAIPIFFDGVNGFVFAAIPLFVLMGLVMQRGGISDILYNCASAWVRHIAGGLGIATVFSCALFAAISGSSPATAATIGSASIPNMLRKGYDRKFTYGVVAAGGTLGILIPPSLSLLVYGAITGTSVGRLFMAGIVPGVLLAVTFAIYTYIRARRHADNREPAATWQECIHATATAFPALLPIPVVLGGLYLGVFTPTEAAAVGVFCALVVATFFYRSLPIKEIPSIVIEGTSISAMILLIVAAAALYSHLLIQARIPQEIAGFVVDQRVPNWAFWIIICIVLIILGCFLDAAAILLVTIPVVFPVLKVLGVDAVHFAIVTVLLIELGMITPPLGMNLFVLMGIDRTAEFKEVVAGSVPFWGLLIGFTVLVILFPSLVLTLPDAIR